MSKEAMKLVLKALERYQVKRQDFEQFSDVVTVLKEAIKQEHGEPVAIIHRNEYNEYRLEPHDNFDIKSIPFNVDVPLFKSQQRTWVGLMDDEIKEIHHQSFGKDIAIATGLTEAKLKEKNGL